MSDSILSKLQRGMNVFDASGRKVGTIDFIQFSDGTPAPRKRDTGVFGVIAEVIEDEHNLPDEVVHHLSTRGFIRLNSRDFFGGRRYATPEQIAYVKDNKVFLNILRRDLLAE